MQPQPLADAPRRIGQPARQRQRRRADRAAGEARPRARAPSPSRPAGRWRRARAPARRRRARASTSTRSARQSAIDAARPRATASGMSTLSAFCLASKAQPSSQKPEPTQPTPVVREDAAAPAQLLDAAPQDGVVAIDAALLDRRHRQIALDDLVVRRQLGARASRRAASRRAPRAGARLHRLVLCTVEPPTPRPCRTVMAPSSVVRPPPSWNRSGSISSSRCVKSRRHASSAPSSSATTRSPARAASRATIAPPAPVPTTTTSQSSVRSLRMSRAGLDHRRHPARCGSIGPE